MARSDQSPDIHTVRQIKTAYSFDGVKVTHTILDPGQEIPWHRHSHVRDTFYVARGPVIVQTREPDNEVVLNAGDVHQVSIDQPHRVVNLSDRPIEFLLIQGVGKYDFVLENNTNAHNPSDTM